MSLPRTLLILALAAHPLGVAYAQAPGATKPSSPATDSTDDDNSSLFAEDDDASDATDDLGATDTGPDTTGALRAGIYEDSDRTSVERVLATVTSVWDRWSLSGSAGVDEVSSASIDVRSSAALSSVDVVSGASGSSSTSGGQMKDTRIQATGSAGWNDSDGHTLTLSAAGAAETDYASLSGGLNGSYDLFDRSITLLGGVRYTDNRIHSVLDRRVREQMVNVAWSAGLAIVTSPRDALRLRYDGSESNGYMASPYRTVRFGDWTTSTGANDQIMFENTIGSADGLAESVPETRISHAAVIEWVHALGAGIGLHPALRLGQDSWDMRSLTASIDLRTARPTWRMQLGYRYYRQSRANFFEGKYTMAPSMYDYYTSDKELGDEQGHMVNLDISKVLRQPHRRGQTRLLLDARIDVMYYTYPGFVLLGSRAGAFAEVGLTWEL